MFKRKKQTKDFKIKYDITHDEILTNIFCEYF